MQITHIENENIDFIYLRIKDYVEGAAKYTHGRFTASDIKENIAKQNQQLWIAHEGEKIYGFVVTATCQYPQRKALVMHFTGGKDLLLWKDDMLKELQQFSRYNGCETIESFGRDGWAKVFEKDGFKKLHVFYELPVGEE
jgi:hypothetical protein